MCRFDQLEPTYRSSVPIRNVALKTYRKQWTIERGGERGPRIADSAAWWWWHTHTYIYIYIYHQVTLTVGISTSLSSSVPIIHRFRQALQTTSSVYTEMILISSCCSANTGASSCSESMKKYHLLFFVFASPAVSCISCLSYLLWFGLVLWHINHCRLLMPNLFLYILKVLSQTIQFRISTQFQCKKQFYFKKFGLA